MSTNWNWDRFLPYLRCCTRALQLDPCVQMRFDLSDVVGETVKHALEKQDQFRGQTDAQRMAWLKRILKNTLIDLYRHHHADKHGNVDREQQIEEQIDRSAACWGQILVADQETPSDIVSQAELVLKATAALESLKSEQRDAVLGILILNKSPDEIAAQQSCSKAALLGRYARGIQELRDLLNSSRT